jgi:hypothetical protein
MRGGSRARVPGVSGSRVTSWLAYVHVPFDVVTAARARVPGVPVVLERGFGWYLAGQSGWTRGLC